MGNRYSSNISNRAFIWIPRWLGQDDFHIFLHSCAFDESSLSLGRVKHVDVVFLSLHTRSQCAVTEDDEDFDTVLLTSGLPSLTSHDSHLTFPPDPLERFRAVPLVTSGASIRGNDGHCHPFNIALGPLTSSLVSGKHFAMSSLRGWGRNLTGIKCCGLVTHSDRRLPHGRWV